MEKDVAGKRTAAPVWELEALTRLHVVRDRCLRAGREFESCLGGILEAAMFFTAADKGTLQLLDPHTGCLVIRVQHGFHQPFLDFFSFVRGSADAACGAAVSDGTRVIVEDVATDDRFAGRPAGVILLNEDVHAVLSTPLVSRSGRVLGVVSTHFNRPTRPGPRELRFMDVLVRQAADFVERGQALGRERGDGSGDGRGNGSGDGGGDGSDGGGLHR